ncbi:MAG TPA: hypothetical protein VGU66_05770 [Candidatus Elarobacter sp.]|nr:hypothetical protein [Candidatus Elarobacter sp.]
MAVDIVEPVAIGSEVDRQQLRGFRSLFARGEVAGRLRARNWAAKQDRS